MTTPLDAVELKHALNGMAEALASYFRDLTEQGFTREEALQITIAWQRDVLWHSRDE